MNRAVNPGGAVPPPALVRSLVDGPSTIAGLEWHEVAGSTNDLAWEAVRRGVPEIHVVGADFQQAGRGRLGRRWQAPPGSSLMLSMVLRPRAPVASLPLLPLLTAVALHDTITRSWPSVEVGLKWPNDVLMAGRKVAGILAEGPRDGAVVLGVGINVDWRGVQRPGELSAATSLAEALGGEVDRWRLLAAFLALFANEYSGWLAQPHALLDGYRTRCGTLGMEVRVTRVGTEPLSGVAVGVTRDGALVVQDADGRETEVSAGDVEHVRPQPPT